MEKDFNDAHGGGGFTGSLVRLVKRNKRTLLADAAMVALFLLISFAYFQEPVSQGLVLGGHDTDASIGQGREQLDYKAAHDGETTRWTNSQFSGMPTYQIAPSYKATQALGKVAAIYQLGTGGALCYLFIFLLGFYIMLRAFNFKPYLAALGAVLWAFSSYFFIIIGAGHIWKVMTLAFIPPTIGGVVLCYRGRLLAGGAVTALFTALQILSNHVQMTYYFAFLMFFIAAAYLVQALRPHGGDGMEGAAPRRGVAAWMRATAVVVAAGLVGLTANLPNLYHTYEYSRHTMRGGSELTAPADKADAADAPAGQKAGGGLGYDYITQWSYGVDETLTLLIPDFKGGGTGAAITEENIYEAPQQNLLPYVQQAGAAADVTPPGLNQYWGNQPFTVGPVYAGALVVMLFLLGLFVVRGPLKWALTAATAVSLVFAWGHNVPAVTHWLVDNLPLYNKFRTVSSALVVAEFTMPLLAVMALAAVLRRRDVLASRRGRTGLAVSLMLTVGTCLALWLAPGLAGNCLSGGESEAMGRIAQAYGQAYADDYTAAIAAMRHAVLAASALRSLLVLLAGCLILLCALRWKKLPAWVVCAALGVVCLADMWSVNRRYLNAEDNFTDPVAQTEKFMQKTEADELILRDTTYYRVLNLSTGQPFNENATSYWHKSIGGYHAAKLQRYQDLIDRQLTPEIGRLGEHISLAPGAEMAEVADSACPVLSMLNMKYVMLPAAGGGQVVAVNRHAAGNGWFVGALRFVSGADAEMAALTGLDTRRAAVADAAFRPQLDGSALGSGTVALTIYEPNELHYDIASDKGGVVVFSEVYYPGWTATIDGEEAELGRADYLLRALKVPAGRHKVVLEFRPATVAVTEGIGLGAVAVVLLLLLAAAGRGVYRAVRRPADTPHHTGAAAPASPATAGPADAPETSTENENQ